MASKHLRAKVGSYSEGRDLKWYWTVGEQGFRSEIDANRAADEWIESLSDEEPIIDPDLELNSSRIKRVLNWLVGDDIARFCWLQILFGLGLMVSAEYGRSGNAFMVISAQAAEMFWRVGGVSFAFGVSCFVLKRFDRGFFKWFNLEQVGFVEGRWSLVPPAVRAALILGWFIMLTTIIFLYMVAVSH